jgi:hypothetical protein
MATVFILFASLMIFVGRVNSSAAVAEAGASYAARTISLARDPRAAAGQAQADAETTVSVGSPGCRTMDFAYTLEADQVTVDVTCTVELVGLGVPATWQVTGHAEEPIDRWRETAGP